MLDTQELSKGLPRYDFSREEIRAIYQLPFPQLIHLAQTVHQKHFRPDEVQISTLLSIKTGGCKENCAYCPQSAHYQTGVDAHGLLDVEQIRGAAQRAKDSGSSRFCMGAAWRSPPKKGPQFERVLEAVKEVRSMGLEVCTTLGMLDEEQADQLAEAGVYAYNHNLDTSPEFYGDIISTRTYQDRLNTLDNVRKAGMTVCCGGIVGMGETVDDRIGLLHQLSSLNPHPESVPVNLLVKVEGTPLAEEGDIDTFEMVRTIATACIIMPESRVRLSAGRTQMSDEAQALCFVAGASSIFSGDKLLTTPNPGDDRDQSLLQRLGMRPKPTAVAEEESNYDCDNGVALH
ncbi:biotin synthase BioB [Pseudobacteriovorax antillogorgiicola]|uniref:Biotin synthase n=1 Tax=Pseudobacteriovorax antillogorgiicola TaxID=1513793 RepID=A0A1Y6C2L3_9BACT|nr:biotin synthase BioB [Pseudobacteriovorax antillogorgiicola]TCS50278.1 biotin synthase [Pseudobacteriovorax antillogorgiicola]SMF33577.1 biotin synthase [Pseudobacteriovorax antillogorgiicola]